MRQSLGNMGFVSLTWNGDGSWLYSTGYDTPTVYDYCTVIILGSLRYEVTAVHIWCLFVV